MTTVTHLSPTERKLLKLFEANPNKVLTRNRILRKVWGWGSTPPETRVVDVYVGYLREKTGLNIKSVYGKGYKNENN